MKWHCSNLKTLSCSAGKLFQRRHRPTFERCLTSRCRWTTSRSRSRWRCRRWRRRRRQRPRRRGPTDFQKATDHSVATDTVRTELLNPLRYYGSSIGSVALIIKLRCGNSRHRTGLSRWLWEAPIGTYIALYDILNNDALIFIILAADDWLGQS